MKRPSMRCLGLLAVAGLTPTALGADHTRWTLFERRGGRRLKSLPRTAIRVPASEPARAAGGGAE